MKVYVAGAGGMLGEAVFRVLGPAHQLCCTDIDPNARWLGECDFRDFEAYRHSVEAFSPDVLIHLGAHTDLEYCEREPSDAYRTNSLSVEHAANIAATHGILLVYVSTAGIFDGAKPVYDDWDVPNPIGIYARSKYLGETIVQQRAPRHFIFRAGWMMGGGPLKDKKFVGKIIRQLAAGAKVLNVVADKLGTPTYTIDFAANMDAVMQTDFYGLYNMVGGGEAGRIEVAQELLRLLKLDDSVAINEVTSDFFADDYFAPRPHNECLVNRKLELRDLDRMRDWQIALKDYIRDYYADYVKPFAPDYDPSS